MQIFSNDKTVRNDGIQDLKNITLNLFQQELLKENN